MQIKVVGSNMDTGAALTQYVEEHLNKSIKQHFDNALNADVHFSKEGLIFKTVILVNEGVKNGIKIKSDAQAGDVYASFNEACQKIAKQLQRYKGKIKRYRRLGGMKSVEPSYKVFDATKFIIPQYDVFAEMESEEEVENNHSSIKIIDEKATEIEVLSVDEAIMKMDLASLPALVFTNKDNGKINVVYHRKDGNISWIDLKN